MSELQQFLYVMVKEIYAGSKKQKTDNVLRIVYWAANEELGYDEHFVIYGTRPKSKNSSEFGPYRLKCKTPEQVQLFVKTVVSCNHNVAIELHQFYGYSDDSEDWYNIDWQHTANDSSTELVAFDIEPQTQFDGESYLDFRSPLSNVLNIIMNHDVV